MKIVENRKEWRHDTVMQLMSIQKIRTNDAIAEAKILEKFVFQDDFIVEVENTEQKKALEDLIKSINCNKTQESLSGCSRNLAED